MKMQQPGLARLAFLVSLLGPALGIGYLCLSQLLRGPLQCSPGAWCMDFRGLNDIYIVLIIWSVFGIIGTGIAILAMKQKQKYAKLALFGSILVLSIPIFMVIESYWASHL